VSALGDALLRHRPGHALPREFHLDGAIYEHELEAIWRRSWLFAGFSIQAHEPGRFFCFELADDSLVLVRDPSGVLHALHNTCRHRGMRICALPSGSAKPWVCPYHQWSYALDGTLLGAGGMERELDLSGHDLRRAPVVDVGGLVFVWPGLDEPESFDEARVTLATGLEHQGLERLIELCKIPPRKPVCRPFAV
jgi:glycine betaine monooxygenase A